MPRDLPVDAQPESAVPVGERIQARALNIHRPIRIVR